MVEVLFFQLQFDWKYTLSSFLTFILYIPNHLGQQKILECFFDPQLSILGYTLYFIHYSRLNILGYTLYTTNSNADSRAYSGIQQCCGPLCTQQCAMCILKYTTHRAANTEHKGRLPTKHIASHNTNSTEGPLWGSPHICSKYRE